MAIKNPLKGVTFVQQTRVVKKGGSNLWNAITDTVVEAVNDIYTPDEVETVLVPKEEE